MNRTRKAIAKVAHILVLEGKTRNIARMTINHNENIFRIGKLTTEILVTFTFRAILTKLERFLKNRSKILLKNASKIMFLSSKNMIFGAFLSKIFERFFPKSFHFVKIALNLKVINMSIVNLLILNNFSLCLMGLRHLLPNIPSKTGI